MPSCVFRKCTNYTATVKDTTGVSFHTLPRDFTMKQKWVEVIRQQRLEFDWMPTHYTTICSNHFLPEDMYVTEKNVRRVKKTAVPLIMFKEEHHMFAPSSLVEVNMADDDAENVKPNNIILKSKIRRISVAKRKLRIKNYDLVKRNNRLTKKCNDLVKIVLQLKRKLANCVCNQK